MIAGLVLVTMTHTGHNDPDLPRQQVIY